LAEILALVAGTDIAELEVTVGATRVSLRRPAAVSVPRAEDGMRGLSPPVHEAAALLAIASPLVGIFRPSVASGDTVQTGQSIGAIEALGMPTSVDAPQSGTVEDVLVQDGSPVEYGQPLLTLRRAAHGV
jgi:acetyl-CoA carboxylase biotin carboxyl carrier protein